MIKENKDKTTLKKGSTWKKKTTDIKKLAKQQWVVIETDPDKMSPIQKMNHFRRLSGNLWWKPRKYTPEELDVKAEEYFKLCDQIVVRTTNTWEEITMPKLISGLNLHLGIGDNYLSQLWDDYSWTVHKIRTEIKNDVEAKTLIWVYSPAAWAFNLKNNHWWVDKTEVETTNKNLNVDLKDLTDDQLEKYLEQ